MTFSPLEKIDSSPSSPRRPLALMSFFMLAVFGVALARLFELTIIHGQENRARADENRILVRPIRAPRGIILDRNGVSFTRNVPSVREIDFPGDDLGPVQIEEAARSYPFGPALAHVVGYVGEVSREELENCQENSQSVEVANPVSESSGGSGSETGIVERQASSVIDEERHPPYDTGLANATVKRFPNLASLPQPSDDCQLAPGDIIGKSGLEKQYDNLLRGVDGAELIEVDANGKILRTISTQAPISGQNLTVNLDADLSVAALSALSGKKAAVVAIDPKDGAILALVSSPSFDPNIFQKSQLSSAKISSNQIMDKSEKSDLSDLSAIRSLADFSRDSDFSEVEDLISDTVNMPLFNRAASGEYPPGSIFKLVTASAGLSENKISVSTLIEDTGEIRVGEFRYGNWYFDQYGRTEGAINLTRAIARSNDIFFYRVGEWLGPQPLADWAKKLGLGQKTGIDLPSEADGLVPDPQWKQRQIGEKWYLGNTYHMAIGQGDVRVTPLQVAEMTASVITGQKCRPHIRREGSDLSAVCKPTLRRLKDRSDPSFCQDTAVSDENRNLILSGMVGACSAGGTAFPFFQWNEGLTFADAKVRPLVPVACKTGTAQHGGAKTLPHAWIAVAAPVKGPTLPSSEGSTFANAKVEPFDLDLESPKRIVLVVLIETSGEGSYVAAPIAKQILTEWFK